MTRIELDLDESTEKSVYSTFEGDGNKSAALNSSYLELYGLIVRGT